METPLIDFLFLKDAPRARQYYKKVLGIDRANLIAYWPLWEASGSNAVNLEGTVARDGTYSGATLGQQGIGDGHSMPLFDGVNDLVNVNSASFRSAFNGNEGTVAGWSIVSGAGVWTDGVERQVMRFLVGDFINFVFIRKTTGDNEFSFNRSAAGVGNNVDITLSTTDLFHWAWTWSDSADQAIAYIDGLQVGSIQTGLSTFAGTIASDRTVLFAADSGGQEPWSGRGGHVPVWTAPLSAAAILDLATVP